MRALVWTGPSAVEVREEPRPIPAEDEVLVQVAYAGICGSELGGYLGKNSLRVPPLIMGHEFSGVIAEVGSAGLDNGKGLSLGQEVTVNPLSSAIWSEWDAKGLENLSPSRTLLGAHRSGAFAEYVAVPAKSVYPLPEGMPLRAGAFAEPTACAIRIGKIAGSVEGCSCLVLGAGPIGLLTLQILLEKGAAKVFASDLDPDRLQMASSLGATAIDPRSADVVEVVRAATGGAGVSLAVDAVGAAVTRTACISATISGGTVILSGLHEETSAIPAAEVIRREITLRGAFAYSSSDFGWALDILEKRAVKLDPWVVEAPLSEGGTWFERLISSPGDVAKVLLVPSSSDTPSR